MKLTELQVSAFTELLASDAPAPGGGSAAALSGALGASLTHMVGALTTGREKFAAHQPLIDELLTGTEALRAEFTALIERDTEAFNGMSAVFAMPKATDEEKAARREAMQTALKECTKPPYEMMLCARKALDLTARALGKSNANAVSDLGVAALNLKAAVQGAWLNILINITGIKDEAFAAEYRQGGEEILAHALPLADKIYDEVLRSL